MPDNYEVGYGKPPKKGQFKKGQSGNSKGRPTGAKNMETVVRQEACSKIDKLEKQLRKPLKRERQEFEIPQPNWED